MAKSVLIDDKLFKEILNFCEINNIKNVDKYCEDLLTKAITIEKYGLQPQINEIEITPRPKTDGNVDNNVKPLDGDEKNNVVLSKKKQNIDDYGIYD